jgi:hypothetical protein
MLMTMTMTEEDAMSLILSVVRYGGSLEVETIPCTSERDMLQRAADAIAETEQTGKRVEFWVEKNETGNVRMHNDTVVPRLKLIEARRKAVAVVLLAQINGIGPEVATQILDTSETLSEAMYEKADQLIAAYEEAQP